MPTESHSQKGITTLAQMGTLATAWKQTDIKWVEELRMVKGWVTCPTCNGHKWVLYAADGTTIVPHPQKKDFPAEYGDHDGNVMYDSYAYQRGCEVYEGKALAQEKLKNQYSRRWDGNCPKCKVTKYRAHDFGRCLGKVPGMVEREVMVGYPQWKKGTKFDSRFAFNTNHVGHSQCELCAKALKSMFAGTVPVEGQDENGQWHGMWVGEACVRKFLPGIHSYPKPPKEKGKSTPDFILDDKVRS